MFDSHPPLARVAFNFNVKIVSVRDTTKEELDHGHTERVLAIATKVVAGVVVVDGN